MAQDPIQALLTTFRPLSAQLLPTLADEGLGNASARC